MAVRCGDLRPHLAKYDPTGIEMRVWNRTRWQSVRMEASAQPFGGHRWTFRCPICFRRARTLFLPALRLSFACRRCHRIRYVSQVLGKSDRWRRRARTLYRRAGTSSDADFHPKPRGMHWQRFHALIDEAEEWEARAFLRDSASFFARIGLELPEDVAAVLR